MITTIHPEQMQNKESMRLQNEIIKEEIPLIVLEFHSADKNKQTQIAQRLVSIALHECPQQSFNGNIDLSFTAYNVIISLIKNSKNIRDALIKSGFIEIARLALNDEKTSNLIKINILDILYNLLSYEINTFEIIGLVSVLSKLAEEKSSEKTEIAQKAKIIQLLLIVQGVTGQTSQNTLELKTHSEQQRKEIEDIKKKLSEMERKNEEYLKKIIQLELINDEQTRNISELQRKDEQIKRSIDENKKINEEKDRKIENLEKQLADLKQKPNIFTHILTNPQSDEVSLSITVPSGSYTKKENQLTFTSTEFEWKLFPIDQQFTNDYGIMKSELKIPFGNSPSFLPYNKDCMVFRDMGQLWQNGKATVGNHKMKEGDLIQLEVNMDITPRTVRLFINGVLQPVYMSGLPNSVQFFFAFSYPNDSVSVISMRNLSIPTNTSISGAQEVLWS